MADDQPSSMWGSRCLLSIFLGIVSFCLPSLAQTAATVTINNSTGGGSGYCTTADAGPCPTNTVVSTGGTVTWVLGGGDGGLVHTASSDSLVWDSGDITSSFGFQFTAPGTYPYHCNIHPNMHGSLTVRPDATHFVVSLPGSVTAGSAFFFTVTAEDNQGNVDTNFNGTVSFTSTDPHPATLPGATALINGSRTLVATFFTTGSRSIAVSGTDPIYGAISGAGSTSVAAAALDHLVLGAQSSTKVGTTTNVTVTAFDAFNNVKTNYAGTVHFSSSDVTATLPGDSSLTNGGGTFGVIFNGVGSFTLTVNDTVFTSILATATITVNPASCTVSDQTFNNGPSAISFRGSAFFVRIPRSTSPYPSGIPVTLAAGQVVGKVTVTINGFTENTNSTNVELLLVGPVGQQLVLMSGAGSGAVGTPIDLTFDDSSPNLLPQSSLSSGTFRPAAYNSPNFALIAGGPAGPYALPASGGTASLTSQFTGTNPNGTWNLYVVDAGSGAFAAPGGSITGWSLDITPGYAASPGGPITINDATVCCVGNPASPYPSQVTISGAPGNIANPTVILTGFSHTFPSDVSVMLVREAGPNSLAFMSHAGGGGPGISGATLVFDDFAPVQMPSSNVAGGFFKPAAYDNGISVAFPLPAPSTFNLPGPSTAGNNGTFASTFAGLDPNANTGTWSLYVIDDDPRDSGSIAGWGIVFELQCATCNASVIASTGSSSSFNQSVTFTATVRSSFEQPGGTVTFCDGSASNGTCTGTTLGTGVLDGTGNATFTTSALAVGGHSITANFPGDSTYPTATSTPLPFTVAHGPTTTTLGSSSNPSTFGQPVTFTATVVATPFGGGTPAGTVTFKDGATALGTGTLNGSGVASITTTATALLAGSHSIAAFYSSDFHFAGSSTTLTQTVDKANSASALISSLNPSTYGSSVTFTATVTSTAGTPTGIVTFKDGPFVLGTSPLSAGTASFSTTLLAVANHSITASYSGAADYNTSVSATLPQTVNKQSTTTSALTSRPSGAAYGQSLLFTASVTPAITGQSAPTGTITFKDNGVALAPAVALSSGTASLNCAPGNTCGPLNAGSHPITAVYSGDGNYTGGSGALTQTVNKTATTSAATSSLNPSSFGQSVTLTATITSAINGVKPNGTVTFCDGAVTAGACTPGTPLGAPTLLNASGVATLATAALAAGSHTINVLYGGSSNFNGSDSTGVPLTQTVNKATTTTTLLVTETPAYLPSSQDLFRHQIMLTATVTSAGGTPIGTVTFKDNGVALGPPVGLDISGKARLSVMLGAVGKHTIGAFYSSSFNFGGSSVAVTEYRSPKPH